MGKPRGNRQSWEYADGPTVGDEVPITSPPRAEERPGVPEPPPSQDGADGADGRGDGEVRELREVRAEDPELSADTNQRLTSELRDVVGQDRVEVPADRPHATRGEHPHQHGPAARLSMDWFQFIRTSAIVLTFAAIIALITNDWWVLALAAGVHALGTMTVGLTVIRVTTTIEHPSPTVAAAMAEEGVHNPDERFSRMVEEYRAEPERGTSEVISPGFNERTVAADTDTAGAAAEQSSAMTPTSRPSKSGGAGGAPDALVWTTMVSLLVLSIVLPPLTSGGWMWLVTAVMVPLVVGWGILQRLMVTRQNQLHEAVQGPTPLVAIAVCTAIAVAVFCAVVAFAFQH
jgi:hypothetical protein